MTDAVKKPQTRTTTIYDKRPDGWRYVRTEEVVIPSIYFAKTGGEGFFALVKPPFFEDYKIVIMEGGDTCFNASYLTSASILALSVMSVILMMFI